jgi:putative copper export protein/methionine-rich copper-binding protein CopC
MRWAAALLIIAALTPRESRAHPKLVRSSPAAGAALSVAPHIIQLEFSEAVELASARLTLTADGSTVVRLGVPRFADDRHRIIVADIPGMLTGKTYRLDWTVAGRDGHPARGSVPFGFVAIPTQPDSALARPPVTADTAASPPPQGETEFGPGSPAFVAIRFLMYIGLVGVIGALVFRAVLLPRVIIRVPNVDPPARSEMVTRATALGGASAVLLLLADIARFGAQLLSIAGSVSGIDGALVRSLLLASLWGGAWIAQVAGIALAWLGFRRARRADTTGAWALVTIAVAILAVSAALSGHPAAAPAAVPVAVTMDAVHVLGAGAWMGGLAMVALAGLPTIRSVSDEHRTATLGAMVGSFSPIALTSATTLLLTGSIGAWFQLGSLGAIVNTAYGKTLLIKLAAIGCAAAAGAYNWRVVTPTLGASGGDRRLRRSVVTELACFILVLAVTAVLTATATPGELVVP